VLDASVAINETGPSISTEETPCCQEGQLATSDRILNTISGPASMRAVALAIAGADSLMETPAPRSHLSSPGGWAVIGLLGSVTIYPSYGVGRICALDLSFCPGWVNGLHPFRVIRGACVPDLAVYSRGLAWARRLAPECLNSLSPTSPQRSMTKRTLGGRAREEAALVGLARFVQIV
jgi:hypothetical protein